MVRRRVRSRSLRVGRRLHFPRRSVGDQRHVPPAAVGGGKNLEPCLEFVGKLVQAIGIHDRQDPCLLIEVPRQIRLVVGLDEIHPVGVEGVLVGEVADVEGDDRVAGGA